MSARGRPPPGHGEVAVGVGGGLVVGLPAKLATTALAWGPARVGRRHAGQRRHAAGVGEGVADAAPVEREMDDLVGDPQVVTDDLSVAVSVAGPPNGRDPETTESAVAALATARLPVVLRRPSSSSRPRSWPRRSRSSTHGEIRRDPGQVATLRRWSAAVPTAASFEAEADGLAGQRQVVRRGLQGRRQRGRGRTRRPRDARELVACGPTMRLPVALEVT